MLLDAVTAGFRRNHDFVRKIVADLEGEDLVASPPGLPSHAAWTLGHLTVSCQAIGEEVDLTHWLDTSFLSLFATGSKPARRMADLPSKAELLAALADGEARVIAAVRKLGVDGLARPLPDARYRSILPTSGHAVVYACCGHAAVHGGMLAAWRRAAGFSATPEFGP